MIKFQWRAPLSKAARMLVNAEWYFYGFTIGRHAIGFIYHEKMVSRG